MGLMFEPKNSGSEEGSIKKLGDAKMDLNTILAKKIASETVDFLNTKIKEFYDGDIETGEAMGICIRACTDTMAAIFATLGDTQGAATFEERKKWMLEGIHIVQRILEETAIDMMDKNEKKRKA